MAQLIAFGLGAINTVVDVCCKLSDKEDADETFFDNWN